MKARVRYKIGAAEWIVREENPYAENREQMEDWIFEGFKGMSAGRCGVCTYEILEITK